MPHLPNDVSQAECSLFLKKKSAFFAKLSCPKRRRSRYFCSLHARMLSTYFLITTSSVSFSMGTSLYSCARILEIIGMSKIFSDVSSSYFRHTRLFCVCLAKTVIKILQVNPLVFSGMSGSAIVDHFLGAFWYDGVGFTM